MVFHPPTTCGTTYSDPRRLQTHAQNTAYSDLFCERGDLKRRGQSLTTRMRESLVINSVENGIIKPAGYPVSPVYDSALLRYIIP